MSILKNEIPILEFDTEKTAVIDPTHEKLDLKLPKKCVFAFLGEYIDKFARKIGARKVSEFVSATKYYPIYTTKYKGEEITLCQAPVGAAPAAQILDWLDWLWCPGNHFCRQLWGAGSVSGEHFSCSQESPAG